MKRITLIFALTICLQAYGQERPVGVNLTDLSPFGTVWIYTNALKQSSGWLVRNADDESDPINLSSEITSEISDAFDPAGYPLQVPFQFNHSSTTGKNLEVSCLVLNGQSEPYLYPQGDYLLVFEGEGTIVVQGDIDGGAQDYTEAGEHVVSISSPTTLGLEIIIRSSSTTNPIQNVRLIFPEYTTNYQSTKFRSDFISLAQNFEVLRFMKPLRVEHNLVENWSDRPTTDDFSYFLDVEDQILDGMPYEEIIELSNLIGVDPWICVPHMATNDYITRLATLFNGSLESPRRVYLEYSNEAWNPSYPQKWQYMRDQGFAHDLATSTHAEFAEQQAIHRFYSKRSFEIFQIFNDIYDDDTRIVKILGTQSDPFVADLIFEAFDLPSVNPNQLLPDAVAIAAYIGVTMFDDFSNQGIEVCDHTAQELLDTLNMRVNSEMISFLENYANLSNARGIDLFAYEGGQHVTEIGFQEMESCAQTLVADMNRLPGMEDFFCDVLNTWYETLDGDLFMVFNLAERPDAFGSFGILESQFQTTSTSPKWQGISKCTANVGSQTITFPAIPNQVYLDPDLVLTGISSSGLPVTYSSSDSNIASISGSTVSLVGVGTVSITASQAGDVDFEAAENIVQTLTVDKAPLVVTADDASKMYGDGNPQFDFSFMNFRGTDTENDIDESPIITTDVSVTSDVGTYPIVLSQGADDHYTFTFVNGTLSVTQAPLDIMAQNVTRAYREDNPVFPLTYSGFVNNEDASVIDTPPTASTNAITSSNVGTYSITLSGGSDNNYQFSLTDGTLTIEKADQQITFEDIGEITENTQPFELMATATSGLQIAYTSSDETIASVTGSTLTVLGDGQVQITAVQNGDGNFNGAEDVVQNVTIAPALGISGPKKFSIYPVPAASVLTIDFHERFSEPAILTMLDLTGSIIFRTIIHPEVRTYQFQPQVSPGQYIISLRYSEQIIQRRVQITP